MRFEKKKLRFDEMTRRKGGIIRSFVYDGCRSVCVSRDYEPDTQTDWLVVSVAMPKGTAPDAEWISGLLKNFGMRNDIPIEPFTNDTPYHITYYYSQHQPRKERYVRDCGGIKPLPLLS